MCFCSSVGSIALSHFLSPSIHPPLKLHYLSPYLPCLAIYQLPAPFSSPLPLSRRPTFCHWPLPWVSGHWLALSPCHWSSLSILTRFGHPLRCGQRVGERGRYIRCSTAPGDRIKMNERDGGENDEACEAAGRQPYKDVLWESFRVFLGFFFLSRLAHEQPMNIPLSSFE